MSENKDRAEIAADDDNQQPQGNRNPMIAQTETGAPPVVKASGNGLAVLAILLSVLAFAGAGFTWYQTQVLSVREEARLAVDIGEIGTQVSRFGDAIARLQQDQKSVVSEAELENSLLAVNNTLDSSVLKLTTKHKALQSSMEELSTKLGRSVDQLHVEEIGQLLRMANQSVLFANNPETAIHALTLAEKQLKGHRDPRFAVVRQKLNSELAALRAVERIDVEAVGARLRTLQERVSDWPLENEPEQRSVPASAVDVPQEDVTFRGEMRKIWRDLIESVSIQRVDQPPKPLLVPEQRYFLNENIGLALSKAELALLQGQGPVYQASLRSARGWLMDYFDLENQQVAHALSELDKLGDVNLNVEYPNITGSYQALQSIVGGR